MFLDESQAGIIAIGCSGKGTPLAPFGCRGFSLLDAKS